MKFQSNNLLESLSKDEIKKLAMEVKETISSDFKKKKTFFTAAQLWDIFRRRKNTFSFRHY
ncbi:MAG: hypothetical protein ABI237_15170 [Ginsengibacter sp.]